MSNKVSLRERKLKAIPSDIDKSCNHLDLTENSIQNFSILAKTTLLKRLILDKNGIKNLKGFPEIPSLQTLWLNNNQLSSITGVMDILKKQTPNLTYLSMMKNPLCPEMYFKDGSLDNAYKRYRLLIIYMLPKLKLLDATPVSNNERKRAQEQGENLYVMMKSDAEDDDGREVAVLQKKKFSPPKKPAAYLAKGHVRYHGAQSEGNRFILNNEL
eukprot:jgi/Bigna1/89967/estExt_fgenesh1_pg.C_590040